MLRKNKMVKFTKNKVLSRLLSIFLVLRCQTPGDSAWDDEWLDKNAALKGQFVKQTPVSTWINSVI